jgi:hypothetical protein
MNSLMDTFMPTKVAKGRADFPNAVIPPDRKKASIIALIKTMAIITDEIFDQASTLETIKLCC